MTMTKRIRIGAVVCLASIGAIQSCGTAEFFGFNERHSGEARRQADVDEVPVTPPVECPPVAVDGAGASEDAARPDEAPVTKPDGDDDVAKPEDPTQQQDPAQQDPVQQQPVQQQPVQQTPTQLALDGATAEANPCVP